MYLKWLPNAITFSRLVLACISCGAALRHEWATALWLLLAALSTDFLDGLAAKKLDAQSTLGEQFDALADSFVVVAGMLGLSLTGHLSWWVTVATLAAGLAIGSDRIFDQPLWRWRAVLAVACLFVAWVGIVWFYAYLAFGWSWLYVLMTAIILAGCAILKRHRIRMWIG